MTRSTTGRLSMTRYLIRAGEHSATLVEADKLGSSAKYDDPEDPQTIVKEFEAACWCAAAQVYAEHQGHGAYDMFFCKTADANKRCPHYDEQLDHLRCLNERKDAQRDEESSNQG